MDSPVRALLLAMLLVFPFGRAEASSPLCLAGCVKAEVGGLGELADALKEWARLLPGLNERFHEKVQDDLRLMDDIASGLVDRLDRTYGKNLDLTDQRVRSLIDYAVKQVNDIGNKALLAYRKVLFETECSTEAILAKLGEKIDEYIPSFQWIREALFGEKFNVLSTADLQGVPIKVTFDPNSPTDRYNATYKLLTLKLNSATDGAAVNRLQAVALDRQTLAYGYYCKTRASAGSDVDMGHVYDDLQLARQEYRTLSSLTQFGR
jgi:hypothetical protein